VEGVRRGKGETDMTTPPDPDELRRLAHAYLDRPRPSGEEIISRLQKLYPDASAQLLDALRFHLFVDLPQAIVDLMAQMELFLRDQDRGLSLHGRATHLIYHLYNYSLLQSLLPTGKQKLVELIEDTKACLDDADYDGAARTIAELKELIDGGITPPRI
jgi:hypothetical protein